MSCGIVDDIEDILRDDENNNNNGGGVDELERFNKSYVVPKARKISKLLGANGGENFDDIIADSIIPGVAKIYVKTWGCTHNSSDSEYMAGQLASYGYKLVDDADDADLWLLNSCTVKNPAEEHFKNYIEKAKLKNKYIVLAGCVPQGAPKLDYIQGLSVIGVQQIDRIIEVVEETLKGNSVRLFGKKKKNGKKYGGASLNLPKVRRNPLIEIISINTGCLNQCTYCKTKHARGELGSYEPQEIVDRIKQSFEENVCEIWLTSEDTGAYGKDIGVTIVDLLWQIVKHIPENCMLRIGMTNPPYILEHLEEMAKILKHPRVYSFLHIPVQSGSDAVLADMKREYCVDDFCRIVDYLRENVPGINIITDIICGFPTETQKDFEGTCDLIKKYKFTSLFINQFFPRPGTPAARMRQLPTNERKQRTKIMSEIFHSYRTYDNKLGMKFQVLVTEVSHDKIHYVAHNKYYEQVLVPKVDELLGKMVEVEIIECDKFCMKGRVLNQEEIIRQSANKVSVNAKRGQVTGLKTTKITNADGCSECDCGDADGSCCTTTTTKLNSHKHAKNYNYSTYAYGALLVVSVALITHVTWRNFIRK